uniref:Selenide, water dikinase n=2 Tax=Amorphochlora amoebiformis TaxID=1561963 RepID=A0A7S0DLM4_9EUKA|mmetsp:Transcript_33555/g.53995  ORF Transcript_33555/g.53995 Transcript_33555/m.53995 type:complete len:292 (+) Transcript_33555:74-949(+)
MVMVHTVDFFKSFISDPYVFGMVAANHALSDCHAMGAETVSALAVAVVPYSTPSIMEDTLYRMMAGACVVLGESNCALVGGHTCEGAEMALGFSVNGVVDRKKAMTKGGMKEGDVLILTKPLGTGTLFAANMRCEAFGRDIKAALDNMCKSNKAAGEILILMGSQAATDVTGFGLLGHLHEMTEASKVGAALSLSSTPFLDGAEDCIRKGIFSSLHDDNHKISKSLFVDDAVRKMNKFALLFDPQTAGGLLASVPKAKAESCIKALKNAGYPKAAAIGTITARAGGIRVGV